MILLAVVVVGLLGLSAISLRSASGEMAMREARSNARLALMLAIGELQVNLGPDQRVSARAATLASHPGIGGGISKDSARSWWVGVSHSDPDQSIGGAAHPVSWLVSGLDSDADPGAQLSQSLSNPVPLYGRNSVDTEVLTGGEDIEAGIVTIPGRRGRSIGGFAWIVDDNGLKAQLAAAKAQVRNDLSVPHGGGVLPGTHDLGILDSMSDLENTPWEKFGRLTSVNDLPLIGGDQGIARA
ncbi:MAG: hypothetical protein KDN05_00830, partial [Verrucomicrobiae bacterium]|nr:hypothetical protein [Verrucomicrobiae bacterium]